MSKQSGNFLLQALLALALVVSFMPFMAQRLAIRDKDAKMHTTFGQIETAQTAARIYIRENIKSLNYNVTVLSGDDFSDTLEPYGLPLGFVPKTALGQKMSLIINKTEFGTDAYIQISGEGLSKLKKTELIRRIGLYASEEDGYINITVPYDEMFSDLVRRNEKAPDKNSFLTDLYMGGFGIENGGSLFARRGEFESLQANNISIFGIEDGKKIRSKIDNLKSIKTIFQSGHDSVALSISRGILNVGSLSAKTISKFGDTGNFTSNSASVYDFSMTAGNNSFSGPAKWDVRGNMITDRVGFNVNRLEISSIINAARGQDVFINPDSLEYNSKSGMEIGVIKAGNITLRDQTSAAIINGGTGAVVLDIRPNGTSFFPDALSDEINNDNFVIIANPGDSGGATVSCKSIITGLNAVYNSKSISQNLICQYVFWQRLEKRIDIKQCLLEGGSDCK